MLTIAGAGMAGLCSAARARELGLETVVHEKGDRAGGSMLLSSCVVWRHRTLELFREECPDGDPVLQRTVMEELDDALAWLESLGAPVVERETGNPRTAGWRLDPRGLTRALVRAAGDVRLRSPFPRGVSPLLLATGGFAARMARERGLALRANPWSEGDGLDEGHARAAADSAGMDEFYGRAMPAPPARWGAEDFVRASQLFGRWARVVGDDGAPVWEGPPSWSENDLVQAVARRPGGLAWYRVAPADLAQRVRGRTVEDMVAEAERLGGEVRRGEDGVAVKVQAAVTHTIGGLRIDAGAHVLDRDGRPIPGLYAAGADAGGIATGGYASGLAAALVFGRRAAESAAEAKK
ncbi:MAG TPA: FAD-binding protein [Gaiellaceae bacterium]|nr:FAD-binding protein [Gaiellaceae bacterium]